MIYLDHNATTPLDPQVLEAMLPHLQSFYGNPSSLYRLGRLAKSAIDIARLQVAELISVHPEQIIFTSGGTEANNLAIANIVDNAKVAISAIEHPSVIKPVLAQSARFNEVITLSVDHNGLVDSEQIERIKTKGVNFVSVMLANNETGVIQNIAKLAGNLKSFPLVFHTDAVQALGKMAFSFTDLGVDLMTLSSHKIYGPKGCGALVVARHADLKPGLLGGEQEYGFRAGTENVAAIVGFGKAAELAASEIANRQRTLLRLRQRLEHGLQEIPGVVIVAKNADRLANTVQISIVGILGEMLQMQLDRSNIAVSSGSACNSGKAETSSVLTAMGMDENLAKGAIRISLGMNNTEREIDDFLLTMKKIITDKILIEV